MWSLQQAKNSFSTVVSAAMEGHPQYVTKRGRTAVVVVSAADYTRLTAASRARRSFVDHLLEQPEEPDVPNAPRAEVTPRDTAF